MSANIHGAEAGGGRRTGGVGSWGAHHPHQKGPMPDAKSACRAWCLTASPPMESPMIESAECRIARLGGAWS